MCKFEKVRREEGCWRKRSLVRKVVREPEGSVRKSWGRTQKENKESVNFIEKAIMEFKKNTGTMGIPWNLQG